MPHRYITITGLWAKDTQRGQVLSCKLTPATKDKIAEALASSTDGAEIVVFSARDRKSDKSPTHNLCVAVPKAADDDPPF